LKAGSVCGTEVEGVLVLEFEVLVLMFGLALMAGSLPDIWVVCEDVAVYVTLSPTLEVVLPVV